MKYVIVPTVRAIVALFKIVLGYPILFFISLAVDVWNWETEATKEACDIITGKAPFWTNQEFECRVVNNKPKFVTINYHYYTIGDYIFNRKQAEKSNESNASI